MEPVHPMIMPQVTALAVCRRKCVHTWTGLKIGRSTHLSAIDLVLPTEHAGHDNRVCSELYQWCRSVV